MVISLGKWAWGAHTKRATHLLTGVAIGAVAASLLDGGLELLLIGGAAGLVPDLDIIFVPLCRNAHRSAWSHSFCASVIFSAAWLLILQAVMIAPGLGLAAEISVPASVVVVFLSTFAHAAEDATTRHGVRLFHPFSKRWFSGPFRYNDVTVNVALSAASLAVIALFTGAAP